MNEKWPHKFSCKKIQFVVEILIKHGRGLLVFAAPCILNRDSNKYTLYTPTSIELLQHILRQGSQLSCGHHWKKCTSRQGTWIFL